MSPAEAGSPQGDEPAAGAGYARYVLAVLFVVYVFNFIDRQVLSILLPQIKAEFAVSDTAMGLLTGFAFAFFYTVAGIPIASLADRGSRRNIIALGLLVWTSMTAFSGLSRNFAQLAAARVGVGIGEAAGTPPTHSLLSDTFPPERRATALSIWAMGVYVGVALAFAVGGYVGQHFGWRSVYGVIGLAGLPLAALVRFTVREPPRGHWETRGGAPPAAPVPFAEALSRLRQNRSFVWLVLATSLQSTAGYALIAWGPTFLQRVHGVSQAQTGLQMGLAIGFTGIAGAWLGGVLADRLGARDERWFLRLPALEVLLALPFGLGFLLLASERAAFACFLPCYALGAMYVGPMHSTIQNLAAPGLRATAAAVNLFFVNMLGLGLGPLVVGILNDAFAARWGDAGIRWSLACVIALGSGSSLLFYLASRGLPRDLAAVRRAG